MEFDVSGEISGNVASMLSAGGILAISAFAVLTIIIMKRWRGRIVPFLAGLMAYSVFVFIFANLMMSALALIPNIDQTFSYNQTAYNILYGVFAAVGATSARAVIGRIMIGKFDRQGDVYVSGIGIAMGDGIVYLLTVISYMSMAVVYNNFGIEQVFEGVQENQLENIISDFNRLAASPEYLWVLLGLSVVIDIIVSIALSALLHAVMAGHLAGIWAVYAAIIQFAVSISFQLYNYTSEVSIVVSMALKILLSAAAVYFIFKHAIKGMEYAND